MHDVSRKLFSSMGLLYTLAGIVLCVVRVSMMDLQAHTTTVSDTSRQEADTRGALNAERLRPSPDYAPNEVVRLQLGALADNDNPYTDAGIAVAFRFASPTNTRVTGPLDRFVRMVHNPMYRPMLYHRAVQFGTLQVQDDYARQPVILMTANGERVGYVFVLSRQQGAPCDACWMTDSVLRFDVKEA